MVQAIAQDSGQAAQEVVCDALSRRVFLFLFFG